MHNTRLLSSGLAMAFALMATITMPVRAELLSNPGFETADLTSWGTDWYPTESGALVTDTAARSGNRGLWIYTAANSSLASYAQVRQDISAAPGEAFAGLYDDDVTRALGVGQQ